MGDLPSLEPLPLSGSRVISGISRYLAEVPPGKGYDTEFKTCLLHNFTVGKRGNDLA